MKDVRMKFAPGDIVYERDTAEQGEVKGLEVLQVIMNKGTKIEYYLEGGRTRTQDQLLTEQQALSLAIQYHAKQTENLRYRRAELWKTEEIQTLDDDELAEKEENEFAKVLASASTIHLYEVAAHKENLDNLEAETL